MNYTTAQVIYFSPTHTSEKIAKSIAKGTGIENIKEKDLTCDLSNTPVIMNEQVVIISVPVYAGRVAPIALERIKRLKGENTPAILAVVYGNRDYEDALVELRDTVTERGFIPLSAGAFIGEHSYSREHMPIALNRPDRKDLEAARLFGAHSMAKLNRFDVPASLPSFSIKGNVPYRQVTPSTPASPVTLTEMCSLCFGCIDICPTVAIFINKEGNIDTDSAKCIKCCACVKKCLVRARIFDTPYTAMLHEKCSLPKQPELFL